MKKIFLSDLNQEYKILEEESNLWIKSILSENGIDLNKIYDPKYNHNAVDYLMNQRTFVHYDQRDKSIKIYRQNDLVGSWSNIQIVTKKDEDGNLFSEISVDSWSVKETKKEKTGKKSNGK